MTGEPTMTDRAQEFSPFERAERAPKPLAGDPLSSLPAQLAYADTFGSETSRVVYAYLHIQQREIDFGREMAELRVGFEHDNAINNAISNATAEHDEEIKRALQCLLADWKPAQRKAY